jgi:membrane protein DedA with SNARE-associated domain
MESVIQSLLHGATGITAYSLVLLVLLLCGFGLPLPEDITLVTSGYLAFHGAARFDVMIVIAFVGILAGDSIIFFLGRHFGDRLVRRWPFRRIIPPEKKAKAEALFAKYGHKIVMAGRFMPGVRSVVFFSAATSGMAYGRFILFDSMMATISAPVFVFLGYHFGANIRMAIHVLRRSQFGLLALAIALVLFYTLKWLVRRRRRLASTVIERPGQEGAEPGADRTPGTKGGGSISAHAPSATGMTALAAAPAAFTPTGPAADAERGPGDPGA